MPVRGGAGESVFPLSGDGGEPGDPGGNAAFAGIKENAGKIKRFT
jgi:hypothetical protein